jgi:hypothetical protein
MNALAMGLSWAVGLAANVAEVDRYASDLIELSTRHSLAFWLGIGAIYHGWARSASCRTAPAPGSVSRDFGCWRDPD